MRVFAAVVALFGVLAWAPVDSAVSQRPAPQAARQSSTLVLSGLSESALLDGVRAGRV